MEISEITILSSITPKYALFYAIEQSFAFIALAVVGLTTYQRGKGKHLAYPILIYPQCDSSPRVKLRPNIIIESLFLII